MTTKKRLAFLTIVTAAALASAPLAADSLVTTDAFLPIVHVTGASGVFTSDVSLFNPGGQPAKVQFFYTPADTDGSASAGVPLTPDLAAGESFTMADMLATVLGAGGFGVLEVQSTQPIIVTSNTINVAANCTGGTFGQFSPGQPFRNAVGFGTTGASKLFVAGIPNDAHHRVNAALMNPTSFTLQATMELVDAGGTNLGEVTAAIPPFSVHQFNDVFGAVFAAQNPPAGAAWRLDFFVNTQNGARLLAYVTIIDTRSGDPYLVTASASVIDVSSLRTGPDAASGPR